MEPEEGLDQLAALADLGLTLAPPDDGARIDWPIVEVGRPAIATFPHRHGCDGFFGARLIKG